jgi:fucose permease
MRKSRLAVSVLFALMGMMLGSWAARIPGIRDQVGVDDAAWGVLVLAAPVGTLLGLLIINRVIGTTGARLLVVPGAIATLLIVPVTGFSHQVGVLVGALFVQGLSTSLLATPMNALAVLVERRYGRPIMSTFHGTFSLGQLTGGGVGAVAAATGVSPGAQIAGSSVLLAALLAVTARWLPADHPQPASDKHADRERPKRRITAQIALLAAIALLSSMSEGSAVQWSAQYGSTVQGSGAGFGAITFTCFSVAMTVSRLRGDTIVRRLGRTTFLRWSAVVAAVGMALGLGIGTTWSAMVGFACLGLGTGCLVPTAMALAGNQPGISAGNGVAAVSLGQWPAYLLGPPIIGMLAELVSLRGALGLTVVTSLTVAVLASRVRERPVATAQAGGETVKPGPALRH